MRGFAALAQEVFVSGKMRFLNSNGCESLAIEGAIQLVVTNVGRRVLGPGQIDMAIVALGGEGGRSDEGERPGGAARESVGTPAR